MNVAEAIQSEANRWDNFVSSSPYGSFLQSWAWGEMHRELGGICWRLIIEHNGSIVAVALVLKRTLRLGYSWLYIPRGPVFASGISSDDQAHVWELLEEKVSSLAKETGAFFVRIDPLWDTTINEYFISSNWKKSPREVQPMHTLILPLSPTEDVLQSNMHPKTRYNIKVAQRKGVTVTYSTDVKDIDLFLQASRQVTKRSGFSYHPDEYYRTMIEVLGKHGMAELAIAKADDEVLAVHIMLYANGVATYAHGASVPDKRSYMAPALLYWNTIQRAKEKGMNYYDFFGIAPEGADSTHPWAGITRMKLGFSGHRVTYVGAYDFVLNDAMYAGFGLMRSFAKAVKTSGL